ncbi:uncharacterized protein BJX67DRAFT_386278 [Aspergillus lucknowensis]|uniref:chitinase n=1 Tax=Aspergillus lucknowensis TaxID=176173 RepID=A0ABR4L8V6_9EURO
MSRLQSVCVAFLWTLFARPIWAGRDVEGNKILRLGDAVPIDSPGAYYADLHPCPAACGDNKPDNWTVYSAVDRLRYCPEPMLFDLAINNPVDAPDAFVKIRACTAGEPENANTTANALYLALAEEDTGASTNSKRDVGECLSASARDDKLSLQFGQRGAASQVDAAVAALEHLQLFMENDSNCDTPVLLAYSNGTVAGIYLGPAFGRATATSVLERLEKQVRENGVGERALVQLCGVNRNAHHVLGVALDTTGDVAGVQKLLSTWSKAECAGDLDETAEWDGVPVSEVDRGLGRSSRNDAEKRGPPELLDLTSLHPRAECTVEKAIAGDNCDTLAARCGITRTDLVWYNGDANLCMPGHILAGQRLCCTRGTLPDIRPKPNEDGSCFSYTVQPGDDCTTLALTYGLTNTVLERFNNKTTWGWNGCRNLNYGINICLSNGDPPMPAPVANAICGPTKVGTERPTDGTPLADLNPCPLNACCNIWGQCGINEDFCIEERGPAGNPGTSPANTNGCVSSCGVDIHNTDGDLVVPYGRVGYYESWNFNRKCLWLRASNANTDFTYTHIHWAFMEVDPSDWSVKLADPYNQWEDFKSLDDVRRIISFGGWGYSTEPETYDILRQAMSPPNRKTFATNVAAFVEEHKLDGVDFDWEYPGAMDIPGTPAGLETDGPNYYKFLIVMRGQLAEGKSLSIAAPASYWYLKAFPIDLMANELDYIVYMTYDLHGQWDAGNQYATEGCPTGNCLQSHVNVTETTYALSMITKAEVHTNKIYVGEASYGRSFLMSEAGCTGPDCFFEGDRLNSPAAKGVCTDTGGYISNAEISQIEILGDNVQTWHDEGSDSDIMVYNDTEWVAYMNQTTKLSRRIHWRAYNFAGTIDWAVDLQSYTDDEYYDYETGEGGEDLLPPLPDDEPECNGSYDDLESIDADFGSIHELCLGQYILEVLQKNFTASLTAYDELMEDGYDGKFETYAKAVVAASSKVVEEFMYENGEKYFSCIVTEEIECCAYCEDHHATNHPEISCRYCEEYDCVPDGACDDPEVHCDPPEFRYRNMTQPCPPDYSMRGQPPPTDGRYMQSVYWTLEDPDAFWADLYTETGVAQEGIKWTDVHHFPCSPTEEHCAEKYWDYNFPVPSEYDLEDVINPKDVVDDAYYNLKRLQPDLEDVVQVVKNDDYFGDINELVDAVSMPVFMVSDAIENMQSIVEIAEEIEEAKAKAILFAFLTAIFFFVPVVGEVMGAVSSLANIGRIVALLGAAGNVALDVYTILDDPENAPLAIFSLILTPLSLMDVVKIGQAARARRGMPASDVAKLGDRLAGRLNLVSKLKDRCTI